jgi:hypothetical protein
MVTGGWIATWLDMEMLEAKHGVTLASPTTPDAMLPRKSGVQVAAELGDRYLLRYLLPNQVGLFSRGSADQHFVTPTPYSASGTVPHLALPAATKRRFFALVLDPAQIEYIWGPRRVRMGFGVEYLLLDGFRQDAIVGVPWEIRVT